MAADPARLFDSLCYNVSALQEFARHGSWRSVVEAVSHARKLSLPHFPHEQLVYTTYLILSLMKLRKYADASLEFDALSDLDHPRYQYQHYPQIYPDKTGSMVPFVLRWLHAELPYHMGQPSVTLERLYALYNRCQDRLTNRQSTSDIPEGNGPQDPPSHHIEDTSGNENLEVISSDTPEIVGKRFDEEELNRSEGDEPDEVFGDFVSGVSAALLDAEKDLTKQTVHSFNVSLERCWQQRQDFIVNCIISHHLNQKDFVVVLKWFRRLLEKHPSDPTLCSKLGYVLLQLGDLNGASQMFSEVERISNEVMKENSQSAYLKGIICRNKGLKHVVLKQYSEAIKEFDAALEIDPLDIVSANNKALCCMYSRDLIGSTKVLESVLDKAPHIALNESLVLNLCSMYELAFVHNQQTKKNLSDWIQKVAPGDFDFNCTRM